MRDHLSGPAHEPCPDDAVRDQLPELLHGRLGGAGRAWAEAHVAGCAACAAELALLGDVRAALAAGAPRVDVAAVAAAVRAATVPGVTPPAGAGGGVAGTARGPAWAAGPRAAGTSRWRPARARGALAAAVLLVSAAGAAVLTRGAVLRGGARSTGAVAVQPAPVAGKERAARAGAASERGTPATDATPPVLASAEPSLGARFDDLTDAELQAVLDAVGGEDAALPSAEPDAALPPLPNGGA